MMLGSGVGGEVVTIQCRVDDGLQHIVTASFGVGIIRLKVDDDMEHVVRDARQPGLGQVRQLGEQ